MPTMPARSDDERAADEIRRITAKITKAETAARDAHAERADRVQFWYDRGVPLSVMADAAGMATEYGLRRKVQTAPRGSRRRRAPARIGR